MDPEREEITLRTYRFILDLGPEWEKPPPRDLDENSWYRIFG